MDYHCVKGEYLFRTITTYLLNTSKRGGYEKVLVTVIKVSTTKRFGNTRSGCV